MQRTGIITFLGFWAAVTGGLVAMSTAKPTSSAVMSHPAHSKVSKPSAAASASPSAKAVTEPASSASAAPSEPTQDPPDLAGAASAAPSAGPALSQLGDAPKSVRFGAVIVRHRGAQATSPKARTKEAALQLAQELQKLAQEDFKEAVKKGDPGSVENAGKMFRGILEPKVELVLFRLKKGEVSDVVPTPRGFLIFRRRK